MGYGSGLNRLIPDLTWQVRPQVDTLVRTLGPDKNVVDLGAGGRRIAAHVRTVDFVKLPGTDYVCDVAQTPFPSASVDLVIATGLLEHVENDTAVIIEAMRILKPGGLFHVEVPFMQQYHEDPVDYRRYTVPGIAKALTDQGFVVMSSGSHIGPTVAVLTMVSDWLALVFEGKSLVAKLISNGVLAASRLLQAAS
jgi:SAM-dependent methyltransferase